MGAQVPVLRFVGASVHRWFMESGDPEANL